MKTTKVIFRYWSGNVIALFPEEPADQQGIYCTSYQHVGQHGAADPNMVVYYSKPATPEQYADLKRELEGKPYNYKLVVVHRVPSMAYHTRRAKVAQ